MSSPSGATPVPAVDESAVLAIQRPHPALWRYYLLCCVPLLFFPPVAVLVGLVQWFRYHTMRYRFDAEGINMRWGILFRREVILNYARIQDIHLTSNLVERWLGLARIQVQTASGSSTPEMTIEGIREFESLRDFLYAKMRGIRDQAPAPSSTSAPAQSPPSNGPLAAPRPHDEELAHLLREITAQVRALRQDIAQRKPNLPPS